MSELNEKFNKIIKDIEKNLNNKEDLEFVKNKINEISMNYIEVIEKICKNSEEKITILESNQKKLERKLNKMENLVENIKKDIYEEYAEDDDYDFEIICPYCNNTFISDVDIEENQEIKCPECNNVIELDFNDEDSCTGSCASCLGCSNIEEDDETEDEDM